MVVVVVRVDAIEGHIDVERKHCQRRNPLDRCLDYRGKFHVGQDPHRLGNDLVAGPEDFQTRAHLRYVLLFEPLEPDPEPRADDLLGCGLGALVFHVQDYSEKAENADDEPSACSEELQTLLFTA